MPHNDSKMKTVKVILVRLLVPIIFFGLIGGMYGLLLPIIWSHNPFLGFCYLMYVLTIGNYLCLGLALSVGGALGDEWCLEIFDDMSKAESF